MGSCSVLLLGFWPQYAFLSSYMNNEIAALCGVSIIFYTCFKYSISSWNYRGATLYAFGIVLTALAYLNAYGYILAAILVFLVTVIGQSNSSGAKVKIICLAVFICMLGTFPFYFLNYIRYGEFLGMSTFHNQYVLWLEQGGEVLQHPFVGGILKMLTGTDWVKTTLHSFVGYLAYMTIPMPYGLAVFYLVALITLAALGFVFAMRNKDLARSRVVWLAGGVAGIITVYLSMYYSTRIDYQPQGRYIIHLLFLLMLAACLGLIRIIAGADSKHSVARRPKALLFASVFLYCAFCIGFFAYAVIVYGWNGPIPS